MEWTDSAHELTATKVPEVNLLFWIIKVVATTLGETGGDAVSMSMNLGYAVASAIFGTIFAFAVVAQVRARSFHPALYWFTIVATTTVGTTLADFADRSLGIGYPGGTLLLFTSVLVSLFVWYRVTGSVSIHSVTTSRTEVFYWITIMLSQTLGTAAGDWVADSSLGYGGAAIVFGAMLVIIALLYFTTRVSRTMLFWAAFITTRPLGAALGDFLDKPLADGGLALSRYGASAVLIALMLALLFFFPQRPAARAH